MPTAFGSPLSDKGGKIIDPPRDSNAYSFQDPSDGVYGYPPGAPIQKSVVAPIAPTDGVYGYPPDAPISKRSADSTDTVARALEIIANLDPSINLKPNEAVLKSTTLLAVGAATLRALTVLITTKNPQLAYASLVPPVGLMDQELSDGEGSYLVPPHEVYASHLEDIKTRAEYLSGLNQEEAALEIEALDPELRKYIVEMAEAISLAAYQEYLRQCPDPELCS